MNAFDSHGSGESRVVRALGIACLAGALVAMACASPAAAPRRKAPPAPGQNPALLASGALFPECARWQARPSPIQDDGRARDLQIHRAYVLLWQPWSEELHRRIARRVKRVINDFSAGDMTRLLVQASDTQLGAVRADDVMSEVTIEYADHLDGVVCGHVGFRAPAGARPPKIALPAAWRASTPADDATWWCLLLDGPPDSDFQYEHAIAEILGHDVPADAPLVCESGTASCMLRGNAALARKVARLRFVRWVGRFEPGYKIDPTVFCALAAPVLSPASMRTLLSLIARPAHADASVTVEIWPFGDATTSLDELAAFVAGHGTRQESGSLITTVRLGDLARVASHPAIRDIAAHHEITLDAE
jgi:hypothetical protein